MALDKLTSDMITAGAVNAAAIADGTVVAAEIADDAITLAKMAPGTDGQIITYDASGNPVAVGPGTDGQVLTSTGAGSPPAFEAASGGDKRNYIIDGDFTQWPEGTTVTAPSSNKYGPALWHASLSGGHVFNYVKETSVLPTLAQSGHSSKQCMKIDVTTAESSVASGERFLLDYVITGTDYQGLEGQEVTLSFWVRSGLTGTFYVTFKNGNDNRFYMSAQTINAVDTWEKKTITLTLDTAGGATWLYTEADQGLTIRITLMSGTDRQDSGAVNTWLTGASKDSKSDQTNFLSDTSKDFYISQVGLYLGATAPDFTSPEISTVKKQVAWYFQNEAEADIIWKWAGMGGVTSTSTISIKIPYSNGAMRAIPTITSSAAGTWFASDHNTGGAVTAISFSGTAKDRTLVNITYGATGWGIGNIGYFMRNNATTTYLYLDARH